MTEDLHVAAALVQRYMRSADISENSVLAAFIRRENAKPQGDVWSLAKHYLKQGYTFENAARSAVLGLGGQGPSEGDSVGAAEDHLIHVELEVHPASAEPPPPAAHWSELGVAPLDWYPKRYSPGDIDGDGAKRLLGTPNIPLASVLVRETAQNSWDARTFDSDVDFAINMRLLTQRETDTLREICFPETAPDVDITESLMDPIWVLEVSDRGTSGLSGPTRNDLVVPGGAPTNFMDLVFNLGGKHDVAASGGTYGFGKTVAYKASRLGTVLMWSRISTPVGFEDRLIGSAIGDRFDMAGYRYTGRHWWGRIVDDHIQPLLGADAAKLGEAVFAKGFDKGATGTSILILCPELDADSTKDAVAMLAEAVRWHLWPKRLEAQAGDVRMSIEIQLNGNPVQVFPEGVTNPLLDSLDACLRAVRAAQADEEIPPAFPPVTVEEVWCQRPLRLLGHLALQRYPHRQIDTLSGDIVPIDQPARHVALMRKSPELVVKYLPGLPVAEPGFRWMGVFKPVEGMDSVFKASEPPAHDDWVPDGADDRWGRTYIRVGLRRIKEIADNFAQPIAAPDGTVSSPRSVAGIADALADLVPLVSSSRPEPRTSSSGAPSRRKPKVDITQRLLGPSTVSGDRLVALEVQVSNTSLPVELVARGAIGVEGGSDSTGDEVEVVGWSATEPALDLDWLAGERQDSFLSRADVCWVLVRAKVDVAVDVQVETVA